MDERENCYYCISQQVEAVLHFRSRYKLWHPCWINVSWCSAIFRASGVTRPDPSIWFCSLYYWQRATIAFFSAHGSAKRWPTVHSNRSWKTRSNNYCIRANSWIGSACTAASCRGAPLWRDWRYFHQHMNTMLPKFILLWYENIIFTKNLSKNRSMFFGENNTLSVNFTKFQFGQLHCLPSGKGAWFECLD